MSAAEAGETIICQDPEMHLHPRGQSALGRALAVCALRGVRVIVESHSEHILNGMRVQLARSNAEVSKFLSCYYFESGLDEKTVHSITFDSSGRITRWPSGFFDQVEKDLSEIALRGLP
jgi:predicted ATPase